MKELILNKGVTDTAADHEPGVTGHYRLTETASLMGVSERKAW